MNSSICGLDCGKCELKDSCAGCTCDGRLLKKCVVAECCRSRSYEKCSQCSDVCGLKKQAISEFNALGIEDMPEITSLNVLTGAYINLEYRLSNGQTIKLLDDEKIYLGNQVCKKGSDRCYGIAADENALVVSEYGEGGSDAELVIYKRR